MTKRAILVVDVQVDFTEGGALAVSGGAKVASRVSELLQRGGTSYDLVIASRDWHNPEPDLNGGHFAAAGQQPNFTTTWPVHCVGGTHGADYHPDLVLPQDTVHIYKGQGRPDYSAFQGATEDGELLAALLIERGIEYLDVVGIATDHCVFSSARDALAQVPNLKVNVLADYTAGVSEQASFQALVDLAAAGAIIETRDSEQLWQIARAQVQSLNDQQVLNTLLAKLGPTLTSVLADTSDRTLVRGWEQGAEIPSDHLQAMRQSLVPLTFLSDAYGDDLMRQAFIGTNEITGNAPVLDLHRGNYDDVQTHLFRIHNGGMN